jgi:hypothetical protein
MGLRVVLGVLAVAAAAAICEAPSWADQTGLASIHTLRHEGGRLCMADHFHYGSGGPSGSQAAAQREALRSWADFTALEYGSDWAHFGRAGSQRLKCRRSSSGWSCDAEGRPCR